MRSLDLNLLAALDVLLEEESVGRAAKRMGVSAPAMSRTLSRIRDALGDPILVPAGRKLVPTARAATLRPRIHKIISDAGSVFTSDSPDVSVLKRRFVIQASDATVGLIGDALVAALRAEAPGVGVRFVADVDENAGLRAGRIDLHIGVARDMGPEMRVQLLRSDGFEGVVRQGHPLSTGDVTALRYVEHPHVSVSREGEAWDPIDDALEEAGLARTVALVVPSFYAALHIVAKSDLVGAVPRWMAGTAITAFNLVTFPLPVETTGIAVSQAWHPRFDDDPPHRWLRQHVSAVCAGRAASVPSPPEAR
jgi:DNA-binding transcriptional LysR family regulator